MTAQDETTLRELIRTRRISVGISLDRVAKELGLASGRRQVIRWEQGTNVPGPENAAKLRALLGIDELEWQRAGRGGHGGGDGTR